AGLSQKTIHPRWIYPRTTSRGSCCAAGTLRPSLLEGALPKRSGTRHLPPRL
ncbi:hypothetical protein FRC01_012127, partial [Tulasnella sp. 417]